MSMNRDSLLVRFFLALGRGRFLAVALALCASSVGAAPTLPDDKAQTVVHMLDYVSVDYPEFVKDGKVVDTAEYDEQREFATQAIALMEQLPAVDGQSVLIAKARQLLARIDAKAPGPEVSSLAKDVRADVIRLYRLTVAPRQAPDLRKAAALFQSNCSACHGVQGRGDGPAAKGMEPPASNFHDVGRMDVRSIYGLYNTITQGVSGTPMRPFTELSEADRWGLAFLASAMRSQPEAVSKGESLWTQGKGKAELGNLRALVTLAPAEVAAKGGAELSAVYAYLTARPESIQSAAPAPLELTRAKLGEALATYRAGDVEGARQAAITAYLEGFELIEASLDNVDSELRANTEREMMALRAIIAQGKPVELVTEQVARINALLDRAQDKLGGDGLSPGAAFASSLLILLREGLEAILVLAAIIAFVVKTGRRDALPYIHMGWIAAVALGAATWLVASHLLEISGASREMTEGISALLAAAMLLYVGYWLHSKSYARAWQSFIREQVTTALGKRTLWAMAGISFLAVYRELFEIMLFYQTLWAQVGADGHGAVIGGMGVAAALLAAIGWAILKYSVRLPIGPFFAATSGLLVLLAVIFVGHGVAALQEAGVAPSTPVDFFTLPLLGIRPTLQGLAAQALTLAAIVTGVLAGRRNARLAQHAAPGRP
jgi:high-affinity iron transporter